MADIKARNVVTGTIKTADRTVKHLSRDVRESGRTIKEAADRSGVTQDAASSPDNAPADVLQYAEMRASGYAAEKVFHGGKSAVNGVLKTAKEPFRIQGRKQIAKQQAQAAKAAAKNARQTIKQSAHTIKTAAQGVGKGTQATVKTAQGTVKTAQAGIKTAQTAAQASAKTAQAAAQTTAKAAQTAAQAARAAAQAAAQAARATAHAVVAAVKAIAAAIGELGGLIAAGGWIVVAVILVIALIGVIVASAMGIFAGDDTQGRTLISSQRIIETSLVVSKLPEQQSNLIGYDKLVTRPAPIITEWDDILAVYSVRAQKAGIPPSVMTDEAVELLTKTTWDMVYFEPTYEDLTVTETAADGTQTSRTARFGVINIKYRTAEEMAVKYGFTADEKNMLAEIISMGALESTLPPVGNSAGFKNPCPSAKMQLNDYPTKPGSTVYHPGRDIFTPAGTPVLASYAGTVTHVNDMPGVAAGHIVIEHTFGEDKYYSVYAHCGNITVSVGQTVETGTQIAIVAEPPENESGEAHLHFEIRKGGTSAFTNGTDPLQWIPH